ncbi:MAG: HDIG domain-containing protein, partial [Dinghuibacter sp.]|nr:HDIG domain-containing protein [Dinghuibacter sp.]
EYAGEKVSQLEHAVQSAQLAAERGFDEEVVLAAFLHDIGHICVSAYPVSNMNGYGVMNHEKIGAAYLRNRRFSNRVVELVQGHVQAKRYLTCVQPGYYEQLSEASKKTLEYQGGRMMPDEARLFEQHPTFHTQIALREIDEAAKIEQLPTPSLNTFHKLIEQHLTQQYAHETYSTGSI